MKRFRRCPTPLPHPWIATSYVKILSLLIATLCLVSSTDFAWAQQATSQDVDKVVSLYYQGKLKDAELLALRTLQGSESLPPIDKTILHKTLGFTYVAMGENEKAKSQFAAWLQLDPLAQLDPLYVSPKIIEVFNEAKSVYLLSQTQQSLAPQKDLVVQIEALKRSIFFPGLGQLYRGQQVKGYSLISAEIILLGSFAYCQSQYSHTRDRYLEEGVPARQEDLYNESNFYYRAKYATALLAAGVYLYSLYDTLFLPPKPTSSISSLKADFTPYPQLSFGLKFRF